MLTERELKRIAKRIINTSFPDYFNEPELLLLEDNIVKALYAVHKDGTEFDMDHLFDQFYIVDEEE